MKTMNKILSVILCVCLLACPFNVFAYSGDVQMTETLLTNAVDMSAAAQIARLIGEVSS